FEQRSEFRTWLYRIAANHLLDKVRAPKSFTALARSLADMPDADLPDPCCGVEKRILVEEAKIACTTGMLICLKPRPRLSFILGEILGVTDEVGAEVMATSPQNFRQSLSRARRHLYGFLSR